MYQTVIFDVDGTLIDTEQVVLSSLQEMLRDDYGRIFDVRELHFALGIPGADTLTRLGIGDIERAWQRWNGMLTERRHGMTVFAGMEKVLRQFAARRIATGIVTSKARVDLEELFRPLGLMDCWTCIICEDDTTRHKPDPDPLLEFLKRSRGDVKSSIYIGDTAYDQQCARGAGMDFGLALWGTKTPELEASYKLARPEDLLDLCSRN